MVARRALAVVNGGAAEVPSGDGIVADFVTASGSLTTPLVKGVGTNSLNIATGNGTAIRISDPGSAAANNLVLSATPTGFGPSISVEGSDANIPLNISAKGTFSIALRAPVLITGPTTLAAPVSLPTYTVANLPSAGTAGRLAWASNGRAYNGAGTLQGAGAGTGVLVTDDGTAWRVAGTNQTVQA